MNNAVMNICVQVFLCSVLLGIYLGVGFLDYMVTLHIIFEEQSYWFHSRAPCYIARKQFMRVPIFHTLANICYFSFSPSYLSTLLLLHLLFLLFSSSFSSISFSFLPLLPFPVFLLSHLAILMTVK